MGNVSGLSAAASGMSAVAGVGNTISQYNSTLEQSRFQRSAYNQNAQMALMHGNVAYANGERMAGYRGLQAAQLIGRQRAVISSGAADVNTGSAARVQEDTAAAAAMDRSQIMNNAALQRWGHQVESTNYETQARMAKTAGRFSANSSLISGGLQFARDAYGAGVYGKKAGWFEGKGSSMTADGIAERDRIANTKYPELEDEYTSKRKSAVWGY